MSDAATLTARAAILADDLLSSAASSVEAIMLCGLVAARIAAKADQNDPMNSPPALLNTLMQGFNAAMAIETIGRVIAPRRQTGFGMAE